MEPSDLVYLHGELRHYAAVLNDLQKSRIAMGNRIKAIIREGVFVIDPEDKPQIVLAADGLAAIEHNIDLELTRIVRAHPMRPWIEAQRGIGLPGFARLLGITGPLDRFPTVSKLWKYLGLHTTNGHAPKKEKGVAWTHTDCAHRHLSSCKPACKTDHHPDCQPGVAGTAYSPRGRTLCHMLGESIVKVGGDGPYRLAYDLKKDQYEESRPDWSQARRHNAAMRYAVKEMIKQMWVAWREYVPLEQAA